MAPSQSTISVEDVVTKLIEEFSVYQDQRTGRITRENQLRCFRDVAQIDFRVQPEALPAPVAKLYESVLIHISEEDCSTEIRIRELNRCLPRTH